MTYHSDDKFCTVLTDASWCPHEKVAGWACWIVCNGERFKKYDAFYEKVESAREAEIKAIINGVFIAKRVFAPEAYHIVSDCMDAMRALQGQSSDKQWQDKLTSIIGSARISFKHVKAHSSTNDKRTYVNNWCDFQAKMSMRRMRTLPKEGGNGTEKGST